MQSKSLNGKNINKSVNNRKQIIKLHNDELDNRKKQNANYMQKGVSKKNLTISRSQSFINQNAKNEKCDQKQKKKTQQLLQTIQIFYDALTTLPLDKLILSDHPLEWIQQQSLTLLKLKQKIDKHRHSQFYQYYTAKLILIQGIIKNIKSNLAMLTKMSTLNSLPSNSNSSQQKSSFDSQLQQINYKAICIDSDFCYPQNKESISLSDKENDKNILNKNHQNNGREVIKNSQKNTKLIQQKQQMILKNSSSSNFNDNNVFQTINSQQENQQKIQILQQNSLQSLESNRISSKLNLQENENSSQIQKVSNLKKTMRKNKPTNERVQYKSKAKQISEFNGKKQKVLIQQLIKTNRSINQNIQFGSSSLSNKPSQAQTKRFYSFQIQNKQNLVMQQMKRSYQQLKRDFGLQLLKIVQQNAVKQNHYLEEIHQLKQKLQKKEESIKQLLIQSQAYQDKIQVLQTKNKENLQKNMVCLNRIQKLQKNKLQLYDQIKLYKSRQIQLRQTVALQRQRTKSLAQKQINIQQQMEEKLVKMRKLQNQMQILKLSQKQKDEKIVHLRQNNQIQKQKQQIYRIKYFRTKSQLQNLKNKIQNQTKLWSKICINCKQNLQKSPTKINQAQELEEIIMFHKKKLLNFNN